MARRPASLNAASAGNADGRGPANGLPERRRGPLCALRSGDTANLFCRPAFPLEIATMWRYAEVLPEAEPVSGGRLYSDVAQREFASVYIKDEGLNPTARSKAWAFGGSNDGRALWTEDWHPLGGQCGGCAGAYAAAAGLEAHIFMPRDMPLANRVESRFYGAQVTLVNGLISDCAGWWASARKEGWFDVSTLKEPFRVEGKKTMGYEVGEQLGWQLPEGIIYPTGGGVGLIGMWKAFEEMEQWAGRLRTSAMISVQAAGCAPIAKAWDEGVQSFGNMEERCDPGRRPAGAQAYGDYMILEIFGMRRVAIAVSTIKSSTQWVLVAHRRHLCCAPKARPPSRLTGGFATLAFSAQMTRSCCSIQGPG